MKDPIQGSLNNIKERHTYQENRAQRIEKRMNDISRELKAKEDAEIAARKVTLLGAK